MKTRAASFALSLAFLLTLLLLPQSTSLAAADGDEFLGDWQNSAVDTLTITRSGDYFVLDDGTQKVNAVYGGGALKVPGKMGIVLATYDKATHTLTFLKEYKRVGDAQDMPVTYVPPEQHRDFATMVLEELRLLDSAIDQWAIETNKTTGTKATPTDLQPYLKKDSRLYKALGAKNGPRDPLGNPYGPFIVDQIPKVNPATFKALSDVADTAFWSPYCQ